MPIVRATPTPIPTPGPGEERSPCYVHPFQAPRPPQPDSFVQFSNSGSHLVLGSWKYERTVYPEKREHGASAFALDLHTGDSYEIVDMSPHGKFSPPYAEISPYVPVLAYTSCEYVPFSYLEQQHAFITDEDDSEIALVSMDGRTQRRLTHNETNDYFPTWSPDGSLVAFIAGLTGYHDLDRQGITVVDMKGNQKMYVPNALLRPPAWSPDGKKLAFFRSGSVPDGGGSLGRLRSLLPVPSAPVSLYTTTVYGSEIMPIASTVAPTVPLTLVSAYFGGPAWSPDGEQIAYSSVDSGTNEQETDDPTGAAIHVVGGNGANDRVVWRASGAGAVTQLAWLPDRDELLAVFTKHFAGMDWSRNSCDSSVSIVNIDSGDARQLPMPVPMCNMRAALSPEGTEVALYDGGLSVVVMALDGTNPRVLELTP